MVVQPFFCASLRDVLKSRQLSPTSRGISITYPNKVNHLGMKEI